MSSLSVVISVLNGEAYIHDTLSSVAHIASEIIVVDHGSTDATLTIAKKFTKRIYKKKNNSESIDIQKNFGFSMATGDWILALDADESVSPELAREIKEVLDSYPHPSPLPQGRENKEIVAYQLPRKNIIFGKWIQHTGWYPDYQLRLFRKGKGQYEKRHVHEHIRVDGKVEELRAPLVHQNYQTIYQFLHRNLTLYAPNEALFLKENGYVFSPADSIKFPIKEFLSRFFAREGYKDGLHGLVLSLLMSVYHFAIFLYLWEQEKFPESTNSLALFSDELHASKKEFTYWVNTAKIDKASNTSSRLLLKAKRKLGL